MSATSAHPVTDQETNEKHEVTPHELLFDLVFVFAVSQLSHHWLEHLTWHGAADVKRLLSRPIHRKRI